jgi:hypothetical protein
LPIHCLESTDDTGVVPVPGAREPEVVTVDTSNLDISGLAFRRRTRAAVRWTLGGSAALLLIAASATADPSIRPDSRLIYVSSTAGDDTNDGLSPATPKRTLAGGVDQLRDGYPDWLFLRRGDTWAEGFAPFEFSGRSDDEPIVVTAYGPGDVAPLVWPDLASLAQPDDPFTFTFGVDYRVDGDPGGGGDDPGGGGDDPGGGGDDPGGGGDDPGGGGDDPGGGGDDPGGGGDDPGGGGDDPGGGGDDPGGGGDDPGGGGDDPGGGGDDPGGGGDDPGGGGDDPGDGGEGGGDGALAVLVPGDGWDGPTPQPATVGSPGDLGYETKPIARWDVVPYQVFRDEFKIGVVAFHQNGVDRVEFSVNDGPWVSTTTPVLNDRTGVTEYTVTLDPASFAEGDIAEVRAVVYPVSGIPRVLAGDYDISRTYQGTEWTGEFSMVLYPGVGDAYPEQVIELEAGTYTWGVAPIYNGVQEDLTRWLTYRPAPGVSRDEVIISGLVESAPYPRVYEKVKFENVTIQGQNPFIYYSGDTDMLWFDRIQWIGNGQHSAEAGTFVEASHQWWTNSAVRDARHGYAKQFVRNTSYTNIGEQVIREGGFVANVAVDNVNSGATGWASGVFVSPLLHDNRIYYGNAVFNVVGADVYNFGSGTYNYHENIDVAIVDCFTEAAVVEGDEGLAAVFGAPTLNLIVRDSDFVGDFVWRIGEGVPAQEVFQPEHVLLSGNSWFNGMEYTPEDLPGVTILP